MRGKGIGDSGELLCEDIYKLLHIVPSHPLALRIKNKGSEVSVGGNFGNDVEILGKPLGWSVILCYDSCGLFPLSRSLLCVLGLGQVLRRVPGGDVLHTAPASFTNFTCRGGVRPTQHEYVSSFVSTARMDARITQALKRLASARLSHLGEICSSVGEYLARTARVSQSGSKMSQGGG